jgi:diguanylate cyclase (GGDEF)-like protein
MTDIAEFQKVGVVYKSQCPQVLAHQEASCWEFVFIDQAELGGLTGPQVDFLVVFFPFDESPELRHELRVLFPDAELIGYVSSSATAMDGLVGRDGAIPVVNLPLSAPFANFLLESFATIRVGRQEQQLICHQVDELRTFFDAFINMVESSGTTSDRKPAITRLLKDILARLNAQECLIYLCNDEGVTLNRAYGTGNIADIDIFEHQSNSNLVDRVLRTGTPFLDENLDFPIKTAAGSGCARIESVFCLPLVHRNQRIGVIEILNKSGRRFTDDDRSLMSMLVRPLAVALSTIRMFDQAERLTNTDDLTKLYNYRYLMHYLEAEVKRCLRYKKKVSLLFIDVDGFKRVNDTYGHLVGSLALAEIGQVLRKILRETDVVGRYGGDEFVVVLPETPLNGALTIAERIRKKIEDYEFVAQDLSIHLTVSLGVANCPKHTLAADGLIKKADAAMYRAKELSKNSVKVAV